MNLSKVAKYLSFFILIVFIACESYLRVFKHENMVLHAYPKVYSFDPVVGYRGIPNIDGYLRRPSINKHFRMNNFGFYGPDFTLHPPKGVFRIMIMGASVAQGIWADQKEAFASILDSLFKANGYKVEVVNCAISGSERAIQNMTYTKEIVEKFKPQLVLFEELLPQSTVNYHRDKFGGYSILFTGNTPQEIEHSWLVAKKKVGLLNEHKFFTDLSHYSYLIRFLYRIGADDWGSFVHCLKTYSENNVDSWQYYRSQVFTEKESIGFFNTLAKDLEERQCKLVTFSYRHSEFKMKDEMRFLAISLDLPVDGKEFQHEFDDHFNEKANRMIAAKLYEDLSKTIIPKNKPKKKL